MIDLNNLGNGEKLIKLIIQQRKVNKRLTKAQQSKLRKTEHTKK
jgi:hypothetical protein